MSDTLAGDTDADLPSRAPSPAARIAPFWQRLPFFLAFPLRPGPLVFLVCLTAAGALAGLVFGAFGLLFKGTLVYLGLRYGFNVLELFAKGRFEGESPDYTLWGPEKRPAKLGLVVVLYVLIGGALGNALVDARIARDPQVQDRIVQRYRATHAGELAEMARAMAEPQEAAAAEPGPSRTEILASYRPTYADPLWYRVLPAWYWAVMAALSLLLPSATIVIALEDAFFRALNPAQMLFFIRKMGGAYFALWGFFIAIAGMRQLVLSAGASLPAPLRFALELGLASYLGLVLCALLGYALYQYHREINMAVEVDFAAHHRAGGAQGIARAGNTHAALRQAEPKDPFERRVHALVHEGRIADAIDVVKDEMRYARLDPKLNTQLHRLHARQGDNDATLRHGQQWLAALGQAGQSRETLAALRTLQALDPDFTPQDGHAVLEAANAASKQGEHALAVKLLQGFDRRFPEHPAIPAAFFLGARLMSEYARQHDKAQKILRALLARYPDHALAGEVQTYLTVLEKTLARP
ncbi:tol-pal system YbgF family protein [Aquabacterium sp.]|uniref:tetratricopeptide repeat protein n=1 Tax=Aquabacterium sp. TaxID=1872578 RepID=UPI0037848F97